MPAQVGFVGETIHGWTGYRTSSCTEWALDSARKALIDAANGNVGFGGMLVVEGRVIAEIGLLCVFAPHLPKLGRLPGDVVMERGNTRFDFPMDAGDSPIAPAHGILPPRRSTSQGRNMAAPSHTIVSEWASVNVGGSHLSARPRTTVSGTGRSRRLLRSRITGSGGSM